MYTCIGLQCVSWAILLMIPSTQGSASKVGFPLCPEGRYFDLDLHSCQACSTCPPNNIIRNPCDVFSNTLCGPFSEFYNFNQASRPVRDSGEDEENTSDDDEWYSPDLDDLPEHHSDGNNRLENYGLRKSSNRNHESVTDLEGYSKVGENSGADLSSEETPANKAERQKYPTRPSMESSREGGNPWKVLALALIIVLSVVCVFLIVLILLLCHLRSSRRQEKTVLVDSGTDRYQPPFPRYLPLPAVTHAQSVPNDSDVNDVTTKADDQHGDRSDDNAAMMNGEDALSGSEYVYFKTPEKKSNALVI